MADPRFYDNRGPFRVAQLCAQGGIDIPSRADPAALVSDVAGLAQAGRQHLSFYENPRVKEDFVSTRAGWCLVRAKGPLRQTPSATVLLPCAAIGRAFAKIARLFYPEHEMDVRAQERAIHPTARVSSNVVLAPGVVLGPDAEIGERTRIGANAVIGRGVTIGRDCLMGGKVGIADHVTIGDRVRLAALTGVGFNLEGGQDYGGVPARPIREWQRAMTAILRPSSGKPETDE